MVIVVERREPKINMAEKLVVKTVWEKGSTTETPMRHKNGFKNFVVNFFFENAKNLCRSDDPKRRKKRGMAFGLCKNFFRTLNFIMRYAYTRMEQKIYVHLKHSFLSTLIQVVFSLFMLGYKNNLEKFSSAEFQTF